jgi:hypothetical protein
MQRNSSRVLCAPGGNSTLNLFGGDDARQTQPSKPLVLAPTKLGDFGLQRTSSRVLAAPGGHSTLNIFGGDDAAARSTSSSSERIVSHHQDSFGQRVVNRSEHGDFGLQRNSSRVLAAPGGNSSFSFGGSDEQKPAVRRAKSEEAAPARGLGVPVLPQRAGSLPAGQPVVNLPAGQPVVNRSEHTGMHQRSSTRIHSAPGGQSTICLGTDSPSVDQRKAALMARRAHVPFAEATNHLRKREERPF